MGEQFLSEFYGPPGGDVIDYVFSLDYKKKRNVLSFTNVFP